MNQRKSRILLLHDDADSRRTVADFLEGEGYKTLQAATIADFYVLAPSAEIAIIDLAISGAGCVDLSATIRQKHARLRTIILAPSGSVDDRIAALENGADHYLFKPVQPTELSAYVDTTARRISQTVWELNLTERRLTSPAGTGVALSDSAFVLLVILAANAGSVVRTTEIAQAFETSWGDYDDRALFQVVSRLRGQWRKLTAEAFPLNTEHGRGYSLLANIDVT